MLSRVAERVYWTARYLERIESTARLISIYDKLLFDLPRSVQFSWYNLITINSLGDDFNNRYSVKDEHNVVKFMLGDQDNPSSVFSSLQAIRENIRTTRDVILADTWELTNELSLYVKDNLQLGIKRSNRHEFLDNIIKGCQQILGLLYGNMPHDAAWDFMRLGRNLERADMTTRNLDAGIATYLQIKDEDDAFNTKQIVWGNVLRSLHADQAYRRKKRCAVKADAILDYLINDAAFPRSITHCLNAMLDSSQKLPNSSELQEKLLTIKQQAQNDYDESLIGEPLRDFLNDFQIALNDIHKDISETWFP